METDQTVLCSAGATSFGRHTNEQLEAMAKIYNEVGENMSFSAFITLMLYIY